MFVRDTIGAGWSSPVARQAHNLKVTGSNPVPATKIESALRGAFCVSGFWSLSRRDSACRPAPTRAYFCSSVQMAVYISFTSLGQASVNTPASANSSGTTISGAVAMSSGMKASEPSTPLA